MATTRDAHRPVRLLSDLGTFELGPAGARVLSRHPWATPEALAERTGFPLEVPAALPVTPLPDARTLQAIRSLDPRNLRDALVGA